MQDGLRRSAQHVTFPGLLFMERADGVLSLHNASHGTSLDVDPESRALVDAILAAFSRPTTLDEFLGEHPEIPEELLALMVRSCFVVEADELAFLEHGFLRPPLPAPLGHACTWSDLPEVAEPGVWGILGVPVDMGALAGGGARLGPTEIRKVASGPLLRGEGDIVDYELERLYPAAALHVLDLGDVDPEGGRMDHVGRRLAKVVRELLGHGMRPLVLGGDHSITHYVLSEIVAHVPRFGIIHFDAHADMGPSRTLSHANVFEAALDSPRVQTLVQIGLRVIERVSPYAQRVACPKRTMVSARQTKDGAALAALQALPKDIPYYLTFDIDCIDASIVRETGTPVFGGLSVERATELVDYVARNFELLGADFVEVAGAQGPFHAAATIAASLVQRCVLGQSTFEPLSSDVYVLGR